MMINMEQQLFHQPLINEFRNCKEKIDKIKVVINGGWAFLYLVQNFILSWCK